MHQNIFWGEREIVMSVVNQDGQVISSVSENLWKGRGIVMATVNQNGHLINFTSENLNRDM